MFVSNLQVVFNFATPNSMTEPNPFRPVEMELVNRDNILPTTQVHLRDPVPLQTIWVDFNGLWLSHWLDQQLSGTLDFNK